MAEQMERLRGYALAVGVRPVAWWLAGLAVVLGAPWAVGRLVGA